MRWADKSSYLRLAMMNNWVLPTVLYILAIGSIGITIKIALRELSWQELMLWSAVAYLVIATCLLATGTGFTFVGGVEGAAAAATAVFAPVGLLLLFLALTSGEASRVVPLTSIYPLITVALAVSILNEPLTRTAVAGVALVVAGVVFLTLQ